jgi:hypothetical protein
MQVLPVVIECSPLTEKKDVGIKVERAYENQHIVLVKGIGVRRGKAEHANFSGICVIRIVH